MNTEEESMKSNLDKQLLTAQELVELRKLKDEQQPLPNSGVKYSACSRTLNEEEDLNSALESYKEILSQKRCSRICDLIQASWDDELKAAVTTKLKGKFTQHMGRRINDKIALSSEESVFLLENGCIEIMNGKIPMSTEEAYNLMLKEHLSLEKYQVFSHLSQLGFIVVPHQKELNNQLLLSKKKTDLEKKQKKRKPQSPLPEKSNNKRLTFSGIFMEESEADKNTLPPENCTKSSTEELPIAEAQAPSTNEAKCIEQSEKGVSETFSNSNQSQILIKPTADAGDCNAENKESFPVESQPDDHRSESVNSLSRSGLEEMEIDCHSADITFEESREIKESFDAGSNSLSQECHIINSGKEVTEDTSEVICCSSSIPNESFSEDSTCDNLCIDEEVTVLEVTKKETTPLAVIDLLSDDENSDEKLEEMADSDDDIKIIKVCNKPLNKDKPDATPVNLEKIKSQKIQDCKVSASERQSFIPSFQFPDIFRKDLVCVPRPPLNLLPLHVQPNKEMYILDLAKYSNQGEKSFQPQGRLWNSYKDMQDYQRARRRNRQSDSYSPQFQSRDRRPWQKNFRQNNDSSRDHRQNFSQNDFSSQHSANYNHWNLISTGSRPDMNHFDSNYSDNRQSDSNYHDSNNSRNGWRYHSETVDRKLFSSTMFGNAYEQRNFSHPPFQNSQMPTEIHGTPYSYSSNMFATVFGKPLNFGNPQFRPFQQGGVLSPAGRHVNDMSLNSTNNDSFSTFNSRQNHSDHHHNERHNRNNAFPCQYRHVNNKTSWNDVRTVVRNENVSLSNNISDIEELPPDINDFLWNFSNISPLIKPGTKYAVSDVLDPLRLTQMANLTDKKSKFSRFLPDKPTLEIAYDVYLPGTNYKKSCPGTPKHRIIVVRARDPMPNYSEIAVLLKKWNDGALLQVAVVDNADVMFCCFTSICLPRP